MRTTDGFGYRLEEGWSVYAWGTNLLDDDYELYLADGTGFGIPAAYGRVGDPRAVGIGADFGW